MDEPALSAAGVSDLAFWIAVPALALGTFLLRYALIGLIADRPLPPTLARALEYVPAAVLPALAAPLLLYDETGALQSDPAKLAAIAATLAVGVATRSLLWALFAGLGALWVISALLA
ncbi:MAG: AzlD domain-containing protein [Pseudomonadota bacterium]